ncbi:MAG: hypothetical protein H6557_21160 [Lewinellaceae bacterium]|nr:hypothetical protein [Phaeodactylibacter sp.]MCB9039128.1 hypothetical protein [Lewinellaceae bacterium]
MTLKTDRSFPVIKTALFLFFIFQFFRLLSPPSLQGQVFDSVPAVNLEKVLSNIDQFIDKPVVIKNVIVRNPGYFYLGSFYYLESTKNGSRILVLSRAYPPKEGAIVSVLGAIQPVFSFKKTNMSFFKQAEVRSGQSWEAYKL